MRRIDIPSTAKRGYTDRAVIFDTMSELAARIDAGAISSRSWGDSWLGGLTKADAAHFSREGEMARVSASDAFLAKLEDKFEFTSHRFQTVDAIAGGVPNVAAYLANAPLAMRRRHRVADDLAPLTIVVDTTSSGGVGADKLEKRGAAILALVRLLSARRPVTLYAGNAMGNSRADKDGFNAVLTRIETAPLDLARAAFLLGHPGAARGIGYGVVVNEFGGSDGHIPWPYDNHELARKSAPEFYGRVFPNSEILCLPPVFVKDPAIDTPEIWLADMLAKFGGLPNAAAA
jgi:hypothetical protein